MPVLDQEILTGLNKIACQWPTFSDFTRFVCDSSLLKCGPFMIAIWWLWFRNDNDTTVSTRNRQIIIGILVGCLVSMFSTRLLTHLLPYRTRPIYNTELHLKAPLPTPPAVDTTTSFPSDHATLFCALATGFFFISRRLGVAAIFYAIVVVCFPRAFLGYHHPTDLLAGGLVGLVIAYIANLPVVRRIFYQPIVVWQQRYPSPFYAGMFLLTYQIDDLFNGTRSILAHLLGIGY
jgi:membrane-associated phospholipid phosphatase